MKKNNFAEFESVKLIINIILKSKSLKTKIKNINFIFAYSINNKDYGL